MKKLKQEGILAGFTSFTVQVQRPALPAVDAATAGPDDRRVGVFQVPADPAVPDWPDTDDGFSD